MKTSVADTIELDDAAWQAEREVATQRFLGISAAEFVERYENGFYDEIEPDTLMTVLGFFPELD